MGKKILLVEDNKTLSDMYKDVLNDEGYEVITVGDGLEAEKIIRAEPWDLLLLDIMLPKMDGISILSDMKKSGVINNRPVIIISNVKEPKLLEQTAILGVKDYYVKAELSLDLLLEKISSYLSQSQNE
ncbi:response regulator [candidate division WWE3 bacterium]|jgi:DNA-binding response OmpR family regulator|uniref:Response regulator n=1 Tax=candidate division WWE3 bacterium TaxID=2053526 RepID=A0A3A4ZKB0_UNCKA|nr:MAG: response regulator [candidate division WWE3 bacterium]